MFGWFERKSRTAASGEMIASQPHGEVFSWPKGVTLTAVDELVLALPKALLDEERPIGEFVAGPDDMGLNIPPEGETFFVRLAAGMSISLAKSIQSYVVAEDKQPRRVKVDGPLRPTAGMEVLAETVLSDLFIGGKLHSPYFIFLRCAGRHSDAELLHRFGLSRFRRTNAVPQFCRYVVLADDGQWTLVADDWHYTLWHMPSTRPALAALGETCDVFACSIGDCDLSFDFVYYHDSRLVRRYVVEDPHFQGGTVVEDFGEPLPGESAAFKQADHLKRCLGIAASVGIKTDYTERDIRVYAPR